MLQSWNSSPPNPAVALSPKTFKALIAAGFSLPNELMLILMSVLTDVMILGNVI